MEINDLKREYANVLHEDKFSDFNLIASSVLDVAISNLTPFVEVDERNAKKIRRYMNKHIYKDIPIQKLIGYTLFADCYIPYSKHTLTPRLETEILVEKVVKDIGNKELKVLDLCTGSGCIGIAVAKKTNCKVVCADISKYALKECKTNAKLNQVSVEVVKSDMFKNISEKFDVIISNPPYIPENEYNNLEKVVKKHDPKMALVGGYDGLDFYKIIAGVVKSYLNENGRIYLEIGYNQGESLKNIFQKVFDKVEIIKDYSGNDRILVCY